MSLIPASTGIQPPTIDDEQNKHTHIEIHLNCEQYESQLKLPKTMTVWIWNSNQSIMKRYKLLTNKKRSLQVNCVTAISVKAWTALNIRHIKK